MRDFGWRVKGKRGVLVSVGGCDGSIMNLKIIAVNSNIWFTALIKVRMKR
jgi:hypothetical protein